MSLGALEAFHHAVQGRLDDRVPLLLLHKTGGDETELLPFAAATAPDRAVIALRGPVIEEGRPRFFRRIAPGVFDEDDLRRRVEDLAAFLAGFAARHGSLPPTALGLSNGANMAVATALLHPRLFSGLVLLRPACPFTALPASDLAGLPVLVVAGIQDQVVARTDTDRLLAHLQSCGADVACRALPAGHRLIEQDTAIVRGWLAEHVREAGRDRG